MPNSPLTQLAYDILGESYAKAFPAGSPEPSEQQLADAARTEIRNNGPAVSARLPATGGSKKRRNRKTRRN